MTVYYTTAAKVASFLQLRDEDGNKLTFGASTTPTSTEVEQWITNAESEIDRRMYHSWRATSVSEEYYDYDGSGLLYLNHQGIQGAFESGTDKIECWDGSEWYDLVANKTEGRAEDWWVDYDQGVIYFIAYAPLRGKRTIRMTYVYGETTVPGWIEKLCNKMVSIQLIMSDDRSVLFPSGSPSSIGLERKVDMWTKEIDDTIRKERYFAFR